MSPMTPYGIGLLDTAPDGRQFFCSNTIAQRHPITGDLVWLHRNSAKLLGSHAYLRPESVRRAWSHVAKQGRYGSWRLTGRDIIPEGFTVMVSSFAQNECLLPLENDVVIEPISKQVWDLFASIL